MGHAWSKAEDWVQNSIDLDCVRCKARKVASHLQMPGGKLDPPPIGMQVKREGEQQQAQRHQRLPTLQRHGVDDQTHGVDDHDRWEEQAREARARLLALELLAEAEASAKAEADVEAGYEAESDDLDQGFTEQDALTASLQV